jgi:hypothetical protein
LENSFPLWLSWMLGVSNSEIATRADMRPVSLSIWVIKEEWLKTRMIFSFRILHVFKVQKPKLI